MLIAAAFGGAAVTNDTADRPIAQGDVETRVCCPRTSAWSFKTRRVSCSRGGNVEALRGKEAIRAVRPPPRALRTCSDEVQGGPFCGLFARTELRIIKYDDNQVPEAALFLFPGGAQVHMVV